MSELYCVEGTCLDPTATCYARYQCGQPVCEGSPLCDVPEDVCGSDIQGDAYCPCVPSCWRKECGDDGCGGSCGTCQPEQSCAVDQCIGGNLGGILVWVVVPGGTFQMGCTSDEELCNPDEFPAHEVTVEEFQILETEVTELQYALAIGPAPSCDYGEGGTGHSPVECVTWEEAKAFCEEVAARLCTEAEWEHAARGGIPAGYSCIHCPTRYECPEDFAWHGQNSQAHKHDVKDKLPNDLGIYGMMGNVWEWTNDWYSPSYYAVSPLENPPGPEDGTYKVKRGGSFSAYDIESTIRHSHRSSYYPNHAYGNIGIRCCKD